MISRERAKLGYFWRHAYKVAQSGPFQGNVVNADTGKPVLAGEDQLRRSGFQEGQTFGSRLTGRAEFIARYLDGLFDYGIADEVHELKGETAQGNALGALASACERTVILTGTLLAGYADDGLSRILRES